MGLALRALTVLREEGAIQLTKRIAGYGRKTFLMWRDPEKFVADRNHRIALNEYDDRLEVISATPRDLTIETTTKCNLRCPMCWHVFPNRVKSQDIPEEFIDVLGDYIKRADSIQLHGNGEPLLSQAFWMALDRVGKARRRQPCVSINSNGLLLSEKINYRLLDSSLRDISISVDAANHDTYKKIRGGHLATVLSNIENLIKMRNQSARAFPEVYLHMTLMRENIDEFPDFVELAHKLGVDKVFFWHLNEDQLHDTEDWIIERDGWTFNYDEQLTSRYPELSNRMVRAAMDRARDLGVKIDTGNYKRLWFPERAVTSAEGTTAKRSGCSDKSKVMPAPWKDIANNVECDAPWRWLVIGIDGKVRSCCHMTDALGDLKQEDPVQIWNGPAMQSLRRATGKHQLHRLCRGAACEYAHAHGGKNVSIDRCT
ncbi:MAG TPA: radical SAM protein [Desulfomonilaceae bacterium]|nr:radical SAM protein [Desulfomonilaceae bacterium]